MPRANGNPVALPAHDPDLPQGPLTIARLLQERLLHDSVVLAGVEGLGAHLQWARSLADAVTDAERLEGVAVVGHEAQLDRTTVLALARRGVAGLLVRGHTGARWELATPPTGLPIVGIPSQTSADAVARHVARLSLAYESHVLRYAQQVHTALAGLLHRGAGINALCELIERLSHCAVAVVDSRLQLLAYAQGHRSWLDSASLAAACREVLHGMSALPAGSTGTHEPFVVRQPVKDGSVLLVIGSIELADTTQGWIVLVDDRESPLPHDVAEHRIVVQQASTIVGTEMLRVRSIERAEERARGNFVHALLHGRFSNRADLVARAAHHDFRTEARFGVVVVQAHGLIGDDDSPRRLAAMAREVSRIQGSPDRRTMSAVVGDVIATVRELAPASRSGPDPGARELMSFANAVARRLQAQSNRTVLVAYGRPCQGASALVDAYREARIALGLSAQLGMAAPCGFSDLRVYSTLVGLAEDRAGRALAEELLEPLRSAPGDLVTAVRAYVEAGGNLNQAARALSVHRNTMLYKIERATKALDWDLRDPEAQFAVWLALKLDLLARTADSVKRDIDAG